MARISSDLYPNCLVAIYKDLFTEMPGHFVKFPLSITDIHKKNGISLDIIVDFLLHLRSRTQNICRAGFQNYYEHRMVPLTDVCS